MSLSHPTLQFPAVLRHKHAPHPVGGCLRVSSLLCSVRLCHSSLHTEFSGAVLRHDAVPPLPITQTVSLLHPKPEPVLCQPSLPTLCSRAAVQHETGPHHPSHKTFPTCPQSLTLCCASLASRMPPCGCAARPCSTPPCLRVIPLQLRIMTLSQPILPTKCSCAALRHQTFAPHPSHGKACLCLCTLKPVLCQPC